MAHNSGPSNFQRSHSADLTQSQPRIPLITHSSNAPPSMSASTSFRRTVESARHLRDSLTNVIREIEPLVETARTVNAGVASFLSGPQSELNISRTPSNEAANDSYYIDLDPDSPREQGDNPVGLENNEIGQHSPDNSIAESDADDPDRLQTVIEAQQLLRVLMKYVPFILILLAKSVYDYHEGIFILIVLFVTFAHTNLAVKKEAIKKHRRSLSLLCLQFLYIVICLLFIHYIFADDLHNFNMVLNLVLIRSFTHPLTIWNLLWVVTITDFTLKLVTVSVKIVLTMLPGPVVDFKKRGKIYLFIEAVSQMYRSIATIQPWLYYLLESYQGPEKIVAVFLSAFYMISKGSDLMSRMKLLKNAFFKLLYSVSIGSSPSKDQIQMAGESCPICHDEYDSPVLLQCQHIFCESCVTTWLDREQTCPLCRAKIVDDPSWRDGSTSYFMQFF